MSEPVFDALPETFRVPEAKPVRRWLRYGLPLVLLLLTICTTTLVGSRLQYNFDHNLDTFHSGSEAVPLFPVEWIWQAPRLIPRGLPFSLAVMSILLAHELGHYLCCRRYGVPATLPHFIPAPTMIGTLGAFIRIGGYIESRAALFDIGIAGPIAGFVLAIPVTFAGLALSHLTAAPPEADSIRLGYPLLFHLAWKLVHPGARLALAALHPVALAGWAGMLATSLNLLPGGQLDGGHLVFSTWPKLHRYLSWLVVAGLMAMAWFFWAGWVVWAILLALSGLQQPSVPEWPGIGRRRAWAALLAAAMLALSFIPAPVADSRFPQVAHKIKHPEE